MDYEDSGSSSDFCDEDCPGKGGPLIIKDYRAPGDHLDVREVYFSSEEYYGRLEAMKKTHLHTMADLEHMYRQKMQLKASEPLDVGHRLPSSNSCPVASERLRKSHSAVELRGHSGESGSSDENDGVEKGLLFSPKEHIKNMWQDFKLSPRSRHLSSSSLRSLPGDQKRQRRGKAKRRREREDGEKDHWKPRATVPKPFQMTLREAERKKRGIKTRSEVELENAELRRQIDDLTECQRKFRASPVPAHVHLPLYEELRERRSTRDLRVAQKPFSFLERERLKKERKQLRRPQPDQEKAKPFKAKPVPRAVYAAASGEHMKEEQLYRSIKIQMRAQELLLSASMPPSMLARRLGERRKTKDGGDGGDENSHSPQINREVPDFNASYRRFQKHLEKRKEVKPTTTCEPFELKTSQISSHRERILADIEKDRQSPRTRRWPHVSPGTVRTPNSSLCSSLSGSLELLPSKATDATKRRHEAVRKALEQRKKAEEEEERWRERQKQRERKLQRVVLKRAQANDPHLALTQTHQTKLKEFRKQDLQRRKEYQQEIKDMQQRVRRRPLLLEQVAQRNAKQAAEKRYTDALHGCDLTEEFISSKAGTCGSAGVGKQSDQSEADVGCEPLHYRKVFLDDEEVSDEGRKEVESLQSHHSDEDPRDPEEHDRYSDDHDDYSDDSERDDDTRQYQRS